MLVAHSFTSEKIFETTAELRKFSQETKHMRDERMQQYEKLKEALQSLFDKVSNIERSVITQRDLGLNEIEALTTKVEKLSILEKDFVREQALLYSLDFDHRCSRHEHIVEAHETTFEWIFGNSGDANSPERRFLEWLENDNGSFWISGKPGAGKSTLMKVLACADQTKRYLS